MPPTSTPTSLPPGSQVRKIPSLGLLMARPPAPGEDEGRGLGIAFQPYVGPIKYAALEFWVRQLALMTRMSLEGEAAPRAAGWGAAAGLLGRVVGCSWAGVVC